MAELRLPVGAAAIARHYEDILDVFIADEADASELEDLGIPVKLARTLMSTIEDREALARVALAVAGPGVCIAGLAVVPVNGLDRAQAGLAPVLPSEPPPRPVLALPRHRSARPPAPAGPPR